MTKSTVSTPTPVSKPSTKQPSTRTSKVRLGDGIKPW